MSYERYIADQEIAEIGRATKACVEAIINDNGAGTWINDVYTNCYRYTDCGVFLSVRLYDGSIHHCDDLDGIHNGDIAAILIGSIVEGSDAEVCADWIELSECESPEDAVRLFNQTVEWVDSEATALWNEANMDEDA